MKTISRDDFTLTMFALLEETLRGVTDEAGGFYLDKGTHLFATIDGLSAEDASVSIGESKATIASHVEHLRFYMTILKKFISEESTDIVDWKQSWLISTVNDREWTGLKKNIGVDYQDLKERLEKFEDWNANRISGAMAIITHTAYHLGAIRQIVKTVSS